VNWDQGGWREREKKKKKKTGRQKPPGSGFLPHNSMVGGRNASYTRGVNVIKGKKKGPGGTEGVGEKVGIKKVTSFENRQAFEAFARRGQNQRIRAGKGEGDNKGKKERCEDSGTSRPESLTPNVSKNFRGGTKKTDAHSYTRAQAPRPEKPDDLALAKGNEKKESDQGVHIMDRERRICTCQPFGKKNVAAGKKGREGGESLKSTTDSIQSSSSSMGPHAAK